MSKINNDEVTVEVNPMDIVPDVEIDDSGVGFGKILLTLGGVVAAVVAVVGGIKAWKKHKADQEINTPEGDSVEVTDEQIEEIAK